jgi:hypothetical protein
VDVLGPCQVDDFADYSSDLESEKICNIPMAVTKKIHQITLYNSNQNHISSRILLFTQLVSISKVWKRNTFKG